MGARAESRRRRILRQRSLRPARPRRHRRVRAQAGRGRLRQPLRPRAAAPRRRRRRRRLHPRHGAVPQEELTRRAGFGPPTSSSFKEPIMKRIATLTLVVSLFAVAAFAAGNEGSWTASRDEKRPDRIYFNINLRPMHNMGMTMLTRSFTGLTDAQINAPAMTPVQFEKRAEAGNLAFEGTFRNGKGAGHFTFSPNPKFIETVRGMGIDVERRKNHRKAWDQDERLFSLAVHGVSTEFIRTMIAEGYRVSLDEYLE